MDENFTVHSASSEFGLFACREFVKLGGEWLCGSCDFAGKCVLLTVWCVVGRSPMEVLV